MKYLWQRYCFTELLKVFFLVIGSFYFLYVLIDYSAHAKILQKVTFSQTLLYYLCQFTKRADMLLPVSLMIASIKVLCSLNLRNEIVALISNGIPLKKFLHPCFYLASICSLFLFLNFQFLQPYSLQRIDYFEKRYFDTRSYHKQTVNHLALSDNTVLLYHHFDPSQEIFSDVYWLQSTDKIYRIHTLFPNTVPPRALHVDLISRNALGEMAKDVSFSELSFPQMLFEKKSLFSATHPPSGQSLSELFRNIAWKRIKLGLGKMCDREAEGCTFFL